MANRRQLKKSISNLCVMMVEQIYLKCIFNNADHEKSAELINDITALEREVRQRICHSHVGNHKEVAAYYRALYHYIEEQTENIVKGINALGK